MMKCPESKQDFYKIWNQTWLICYVSHYSRKNGE